MDRKITLVAKIIANLAASVFFIAIWFEPDLHKAQLHLISAVVLANYGERWRRCGGAN